VNYLPQRPGGARGPSEEGTGEGGEAHGGDGAQGIGREAGFVLGFGPRSSDDRVGERRADETADGWRNGGGGGGRGAAPRLILFAFNGHVEGFTANLERIDRDAWMILVKFNFCHYVQKKV